MERLKDHRATSAKRRLRSAAMSKTSLLIDAANRRSAPCDHAAPPPGSGRTRPRTQCASQSKRPLSRRDTWSPTHTLIPTACLSEGTTGVILATPRPTERHPEPESSSWADLDQSRD